MFVILLVDVYQINQTLSNAELTDLYALFKQVAMVCPCSIPFKGPILILNSNISLKI